jgi:hypothetical protein
MNAGDQKGKFITIYVGPLMYSFLAMVKRLILSWWRWKLRLDRKQ